MLGMLICTDQTFNIINSHLVTWFKNYCNVMLGDVDLHQAYNITNGNLARPLRLLATQCISTGPAGLLLF